MAVLKSKRKPSKFEVFHHLYKLRREITDLLLRDFGYSFPKEEKRLSKRFGNRPFEDLSDTEKAHWERLKARWEAFDDWFVKDERTVIIDCLREITKHVFIANSIYPQYYEELVQRRLHQDEALGQCFRLMQELQYAIEVLPVDVNAYTRFAEMVQDEVNLIKAWRKSDNRLKPLVDRATSDTDPVVSGTNFANCNNNGNCNNNNASNSNGVRPDFDTTV